MCIRDSNNRIRSSSQVVATCPNEGVTVSRVVVDAINYDSIVAAAKCVSGCIGVPVADKGVSLIVRPSVPIPGAYKSVSRPE